MHGVTLAVFSPAFSVGLRFKLLCSIAVAQPHRPNHNEFLLTIPGGGNTFASSGRSPIVKNNRLFLSQNRFDTQLSISPPRGNQGQCLGGNENRSGTKHVDLQVFRGERPLDLNVNTASKTDFKLLFIFYSAGLL